MKKLERELLDLENRYWQAMQEKDVETALDMTDEPCIVTGASGVGEVDNQEFAQMMKNAKWDIVDFSIGDDATVRMLGRNTAILAYNVHEELRVDGEPVSIDAADASTWVRRDGHWLCALHTESLLGDPYGRDRVRTLAAR